MDSTETPIPDNEGNHLVVVLYFYDDNDKAGTFQIPQEFAELDITDININKLDPNKPLRLRAFYEMRHTNIPPEQCRWRLFECLFMRNRKRYPN